MKLKDREIQVLNIIIKNENLKEHLIGNDDKGPLKKLIDSYNKINLNIFALKDESDNTLLTLLTLNNAHEILNYKDLLPFIKKENFDYFLPIEKLADSLNKNSFEALSILGDHNRSFRIFINRIKKMPLNEDGKKTLQELKEHFASQIEQDLQEEKKRHDDMDSAANEKQPLENPQMTEQEIMASSATNQSYPVTYLPTTPFDDSQLYSRDKNSYPVVTNLPTTPFDDSQRLQRQLRHNSQRYYGKNNQYSFYSPHSHSDAEVMPEFNDNNIERMPEGPNFT